VVTLNSGMILDPSYGGVPFQGSDMLLDWQRSSLAGIMCLDSQDHILGYIVNTAGLTLVVRYGTQMP
jgi:hypothetical protein